MPKRQEERISAVDQAVGRRLTIRRLDRRVAQQTLAAELGISFQQLQKYERGTNRISAGRLFEVARYLGVKPSYFFQDVEVTGSGKTIVHTPAEPILIPKLRREGLRLQTAYARLKSADARKTIAEFIERLATRDGEAKGS